MTRKKFIKQLMAQGVQRNDAEFTAFLYRHAGYSYSSALKDYNYRNSLKKSIQRIGKAMKEFAAGIEKAAESAKRLAAALAGGGGHE